jgi:hypothetical protein
MAGLSLPCDRWVGKTLVSAAATDAWESIRRGVARLTCRRQWEPDGDDQQRFAQNRWIRLNQLSSRASSGKANAPTRTGAPESTRHSPISSAMPGPHFLAAAFVT